MKTKLQLWDDNTVKQQLICWFLVDRMGKKRGRVLKEEKLKERNEKSKRNYAMARFSRKLTKNRHEPVLYEQGAK